MTQRGRCEYQELRRCSSRSSIRAYSVPQTVPSPKYYNMRVAEEETNPTKTEEQTSQRHPNLAPYDVICGRHRLAFNNIGNRRFRVTIALSLPEYFSARTRQDKSDIIVFIVALIHDCGGRFLSWSRNRWTELDERQCRAKVGHAIRDMSYKVKNISRKCRPSASQTINEVTKSESCRPFGTLSSSSPQTCTIPPRRVSTELEDTHSGPRKSEICEPLQRSPRETCTLPPRKVSIEIHSGLSSCDTDLDVHASHASNVDSDSSTVANLDTFQLSAPTTAAAPIFTNFVETSELGPHDDDDREVFYRSLFRDHETTVNFHDGTGVDAADELLRALEGKRHSVKSQVLVRILDEGQYSE